MSTEHGTLYLEARSLSRRGFFFASGALFLAGCAKSQSTGGDGLLTSLPAVPWPARDPLPPVDSGPSVPSGPSAANSFPTVIARTRWAKGGPVSSLMNPMLPVSHITIHHDGMSVFTGSSSEAAAERIELIRRGHRGKAWGDIGYHFIVDRLGQVWEGRPLNWQGAHVKDHNEGNIGILALGNFDAQSPTDAQVEGVRRHVVAVMRHYNISAGRVKTHQEWAPTACPGRTMQPKIVALRSRGFA